MTSGPTSTASAASNGRDALALRLTEKASEVEYLRPRIEQVQLGPVTAGEALVAVHAAAVNPSDLKAALGLMPYAVFPRTPGRDFAGVVLEGPAHLIGREVFGSSGDLGIRRDGTHASHLVVEADALVEKPAAISLDEAAGIGVPFVTAHEGLQRAGMPGPGETVLVLGISGKVGQAVAQVATWRGAQVIGVARRSEPYKGHASGSVDVVDASSVDVAARVKELTNGHGADLVFNTVGDPYYAAGTAALATRGRQVFIAAVNRIVEFDIFAFYRGRHTYIGVDTLALSSFETGTRLRELVPGFATGQLRPFPIKAGAIFPLSAAADAYRSVLDARDRVILRTGA